MMKITVDISKHDGTRLSTLENFSDEELEKDFKQKEQDREKDKDLAIPRNDEVTEERMHVTKANWLGRMERDTPKRDIL